jgi:UDP-N-acetylmuramate dehydrogenase
MVSLEKLQSVFKGEILLGEPLAKYTSFKIGGPADVFLKPRDKDDIVQAVRFFDEQKWQYMLLGRGSNILVSDEGFRGAVMTLRDNLEKVEITGETVYAEAGCDLPSLALMLTKKNLGGMEALSGIPGSLGGAVIMNAGAYGKEIFEVIEWVEVIRGGKVKRLKKNDIAFQYRGTDLNDDVVLAVQFKLKPLTDDEKAKALDDRKEWMAKRSASQPLNFPNAGSIFKNPQGTFAGKLIEECGLKGHQIGGAMISEKHANFIVNTDEAKADDVMQLITIARTEVKQKFGIDLELEIKLIGF